MKNRMLALVTALVMAAASLGVGTTLVSQASTETTTQTPKKCKKCKKVIKKAKKCKKSGNNSAKCKKIKKKARKCKKTLRSRQCKKPSTNPSPSPSGSGGSGAQEVKGEIAQPNPFPQDPNSCYAGKHRRAAIATGGANQGVDGYHFDLVEGTQGTNFILTVDSGEQDPDLDITFYTELGTQQQAADPQHAPPNQTYEKRGPGGESGVVPEGMKVAIVCMLTGFNATFTYTAGPGVGTPKTP
jgi:hypothetical protein